MIDRRSMTQGIFATAATLLLDPRPARAAVSSAARNVVLVHGLFADGSSWSEVIPLLQAAGLDVTSVQNPLDDYTASVASVRRVLDRQEGPTILAGHSFGGMLVTEAGLHPAVSALVYVAARAPDSGENYRELAARFPTPPAASGIIFDGNEGRLELASFLRDFAGDLPEARAKLLFAVQQPFDRALLDAVVARAAWREKKSFYAISADDRTIDPGLQRFMARRMNAETIELAASHLSLVSQPRAIADLILRAAGR